MAFCLNCGQRLADGAGRCASCGAPVEGSDTTTDDSGLTNEVRKLALDGRKIEAINAYREATGSSLADAKDSVEAWLRGDAPTTVARSLSLNDDATEHARAGRKIAAIKAYRDATRCSLKEAKQAVDAWMHAEGIESRGGCAASLVMLLGIVAIGWWGRC